MSTSGDRGESFDEILAAFLADLERGADREQLIQAYARRYPDQAAEFRDYAPWPNLLDAVSDPVDEHRPARLGDFRIVRELSQGGMKTVYEAIQEPLERRVAVATIRRGRISPAHRERFLREQRVLAQLHQTHIVPIFAAGEEGPIQYFAMPYIEGASLHHIIQAASRTETRRTESQTPSLKELAQCVLQPAAANATTCDATRVERPQAPGTSSAGPVAEAAVTPAPRPLLSREYYRSVARVMADVAESLHHAHEHGVLHRDLKPANIMVGTDERSWLIDFGLAGFLQTPDCPTVSAHALEADTALTSTRGVLGTPGYMAPEQEAGERVDARTDVWGLGATLYELLTLHRAFPNQLRRESASAPSARIPPAPRSMMGNIPRDLEAICMKSLREDPAGRYPTAAAVADDLHRWLRGEPTLAHPARAPRRTYLWARRNKGWAAAIAVSLLGLLGLAMAGYLVERARAKKQERESQLLQIAHLLTPAQASGWSSRAWELERQVAESRHDDRVRNQAAAILHGLDVGLVGKLPEFGAQTMRFDPAGERLLMGTLTAASGKLAAAKLWHVGEDRLQDLQGAGFGPVAFAGDGTPLQLTVAPARNELTLIDLSQGKVASRFALPVAGLQFSDELAVSADGSSVAAATTGQDGQPAGILLWHAASRDWLPLLPFRAAGALAYAPDGTLLAAGDEDGLIAVWSVRTGRPVASLQGSRNGIRSLAFGRNCRRAPNMADRETDAWLLAAGDEGGTITIWDLTRQLPRSYCRGNGYDVSAVVFSPDGVTLACSGHSEVRIWDALTGQPLLNPTAYSDDLRGLAFSPNGRLLAAGGQQHERRSVAVWELTAGRGVRSLRGLACPISRTCFSPDSRYIAALAHNWELGIWDLQTGFPLYVLEAPRGIFADNAALAFSPDGKRFAFSAGQEAKAWDVATGREVQRWELPEGFVDCLVYAAPDRLLSLRTETKDGRLGPYSTAPRDLHPRVCQLRELPEQGPPRSLREITDFNWHVLCAAASPTGQHFAIEGLAGSRGRLRRVLKVFDATGRELAALPTPRTADESTAMLVFEPTGKLLGVFTTTTGLAEMTLFEMPACREVRKLGFSPLCFSPGEVYYGVSGPGLALLGHGKSEPLVVFDPNQSLPTVQPQFDATGTRLAWGRTDGTVVVADLPEVRRRLAELGLGW
jgi:eukaryotic-like serine/threonine-protein kinase